MGYIVEDFGHTGTLASGSYVTSMLDVSRFASLRYFVFCAANCSVNLRWSVDNINVDLVDTVSVVAGSEVNGASPIRARYLQIEYLPAITPTPLRAQVFFFDLKDQVNTLENVGSGVQLYKSAGHQIRTAISSDSSVTLTQLVDEIDIKANGSNVTLASAGGSKSLVSDGVGPSLAVKGVTAGTGIVATDNSTYISVALDPSSASLYNSYGGVNRAASYTQSIVNTTPTVITPATTVSSSVYEFTQLSNGVLQYIGAYSKTFSAMVDFDFNTTDATQTFTFELRLNGVSILSQRTSLTHSEYEHISLQAYTTMVTSDALSVYAYNSGGAPINTTVAGFNLRAVQMYFPIAASPPTGNGEYQMLCSYGTGGYYPYVWQSTTTPNPYINIMSNLYEFKGTYPGNYQFTIGTQVYAGGAYAVYTYYVYKNGLLITNFPMSSVSTDGFSFNLTLAVSDLVTFGINRTSGSGGRTMNSPLYITSAPTASASSGSYTLSAGVSVGTGVTTTWTWGVVSQYNPNFTISVPSTTFQCNVAGTYRFGYSHTTISGGTYSTNTWYLFVNGVSVYSHAFTDNVTVAIGDSTTYALVAGDLVQVKWGGTFVSGTRTIIPTIVITM